MSPGRVWEALRDYGRVLGGSGGPGRPWQALKPWEPGSPEEGGPVLFSLVGLSIPGKSRKRKKLQGRPCGA